MEALIDIVLLAIVAIVAWCVSGEGAWGAGLVFLSVLFGGLLAMNYFEPLANLLERNISLSWSHRWDIIALLGLFVLFVTLFRLATEKIMPTYVQVQAHTHQLGSWGFGLLTGYVVMAVLLTALHTAPLPREFIGFKPERRMLFGLAPDRQWLGFTQYVTERPFARMARIRDSATGQEHVAPRMFDGRTGWYWNVSGEKYQNQVMPSFIIRYADRRERFSTSVAARSTRPSGGPSIRRRARPGRSRGTPSF